jgi:hypothetical protein
VLFEVRLSELMADLLGVQSIVSAARHPSAGAAVKQMTRPAFASAVGQMRRPQCRGTSCIQAAEDAIHHQDAS